MSKPNTPSDVPRAFSPLTIAGHQLMLDALRAEFSVLQTMLPGLGHADAPNESDGSADPMFDNMPV